MTGNQQPITSTSARALRVLYVVRGLNQSSGTTHAVIPMAEEMARRGHDVCLYAVRKPAGTAEVIPDPGMVRTSVFDMSLPLNHPGISLGFAKAVQREIHGFDIVHIQAVRNFVTWWTMRCAHEAGVPYVVAPQGSYDPWVLARRSSVNRWWDRWFEVPLLSRAAWIQCLTTREVEQVRNMGIKASSIIIPNGVEPATCANAHEKQDARRAFGIAEDAVVIMFLGRIHPKKGLDILVRAFSQIQVPGLIHQPFLLIAGSDGGSGYRSEIEGQFEKIDISDKVKWLDEVTGGAKTQALRAADIFVLPSRSEGLPVAVLEAMAAELPVVVSKSCNLPEVGQWNAGRVVSEDAVALSEALKELVADPQLRVTCGTNGRRLVEAKFMWTAIADATIESYGRIVN
jgi:glycosyltransferase involved in cell wall biosynthesis